jgi:membrane protein YdbS with pleckstrin-like domain
MSCAIVKLWLRSQKAAFRGPQHVEPVYVRNRNEQIILERHRSPQNSLKEEQMGYIQDSLSNGEQVRGLFKLHWFSKVPMVIWIILAIPTLGLTLILAIREWLRLRSIEQGVTNKRVILKKGIISRKSEEMKISSIETVEIIQGVMGRMFGYGTIKVTGRGISDLIFKNIDDPMDVKRKIESVDSLSSDNRVGLTS